MTEPKDRRRIRIGDQEFDVGPENFAPNRERTGEIVPNRIPNDPDIVPIWGQGRIEITGTAIHGGLTITATNQPLYFTATPHNALRLTTTFRRKQCSIYYRRKVTRGVAELDFFRSCLGRMEDGEAMRPAHTNMYTAGMLGTPLEFQMERICIASGGTSPEGWRDILGSNMSLEFVTGMNQVNIQFPIHIMERIPLVPTETTEIPEELRERLRDINMARTRDGEYVNMAALSYPCELHIDSTTLFHLRMSFFPPYFGVDADIFVHLRGTMYEPVR